MGDFIYETGNVVYSGASVFLHTSNEVTSFFRKMTTNVGWVWSYNWFNDEVFAIILDYNFVKIESKFDENKHFGAKWSKYISRNIKSSIFIGEFLIPSIFPSLI